LAGAPPVEEVARFASDHHFPVMLIDTWQKDGKSALAFIDPPACQAIVAWLRSRAVAIALAGSLGEGGLPAIGRINPEWVAVRGAACASGNRRGSISALLVRQFRRRMRESTMN